jgi:hypothetical protein
MNVAIVTDAASGMGRACYVTGETLTAGSAFR